MELWGTAYSFHATTVTKLAGLVAASTHDSGGGTIRIVFDNNGDVIKVNATDQTIEVVIKWEVILQLTTLLHVLVLQNRLLRSEDPVLPAPTHDKRIFNVWGRIRAGFFACGWATTAEGISYNPALDPEAPDHVEIVLSEAIAVEFISALTEAISRNGIRNHLELRQQTGG
ncbi:MAG: hypothetical protein IPM54_17330 [Polyangiaceae bacterium]|nr:hypothetical protein [Polyangiaceae bacterium]